MKICSIPIAVLLYSSRTAYNHVSAFSPIQLKALQSSSSNPMVMTAASASASLEGYDNDDDEVMTEDDFWAAEKVRQAKLSGSDNLEFEDNDGGFELILNDDNEDEDKDKDSSSSSIAIDKGNGKGSAWDKMHPLARLKLIEKRQQRAIANKKKNESSKDKKRKLMMTYKSLQVRKERDRRAENRVERPIPLYEMSEDGDVKAKKLSSQRVQMSDLEVGQERQGTVISLQKFGVYVDVASTRDALLHISDMVSEGFIEHPRQKFSPGDDVTVYVKYTDPENNRLAVSMIPIPEKEEDEDDEDLIQLDEVDVDDELWGVVKKVTDYGAYIDLGAVVEGFLHFMDHPDFGINKGAHPSEYLKTGQRIRVWVNDVNDDMKRIKLTGNRPTSLPVIRRAISLSS